MHVKDIARRVLALLAVTLTIKVSHADTPWLTGKKLNAALLQPVSVVREGAGLREILGRLAGVRRTACVLDRRIDPSQPVSLQLQQAPLRLAFDEAAAQVGAVCAPIGGTLLIGRAAEIDPLLTQAELLQTKLKRDRGVPAARRLTLLREREFSWDDLETPREIVDRIAGDWDLAIENAEVIPHDLWAAGSAAGVDVVQVLSLVLGQFGLSFEFQSGAKTIAIVPLPDRVIVEQTHRPQEMSLAAAAEVVSREWPEATVRRQRSTLQVTASMLEHEAIARRLGERPHLKTTNREPVPLSRMRFPIRVVRKPVGAILQALAAQGVSIEYDADALTAAGADLTTLVTLEFQSATVEELLEALCEPAGMAYEIDGETVRLKAAREIR